MKRAPERGHVAVDKLPHRFAKGPDGKGIPWPEKAGYSRINVCSGAPGINKQLSPMLLGPITVSQHGWSAATDPGKKHYDILMPGMSHNLENLWYVSVLYSPFDKQQAGQ